MHKRSINGYNVEAIILVGSRDFGRCPVATRLPTALWPVAGEPALQRLLNHLAKEGIRRVTICSNGDGSLLAESIEANKGLKLKFLHEPLPVGPAGCIRDAVGFETGALLLVLPASIVRPPKIDALIKAHRDGQSCLTVMLNPNQRNGQSMGQAADIYICNPGILEHIPKEGYFDIKEGLIPEMLRAGRSVHAARLPYSVGHFRDRQEYLHAVADYLENTPKLDSDFALHKRTNSQTVWMAASAKVDTSARLYGPVAIMDGACISKSAVVIGPAIVGRNVIIREGSVVVNSALWDDAYVGPNCQIQQCIVDYRVAVSRNTVVEEESIPFKAEGVLQTSVNKAVVVMRNSASKLRHTLQPQPDKINHKPPSRAQSHKIELAAWLGSGLALIAFLWSYWPGFVDLWNIWQRSDEYSCGLLVPFLAVYILWSRRHDIARCRIRPSIWGIFAFLAAQAIRLFGLFFMYGSAQRLSIVLSFAALVLLLFGWELFQKVSTTLLFLCLMLPWPQKVHTALSLPLQDWATTSAVFCLEALGYEVTREGHIIDIGPASVAVAEACTGLRMITAFFVISGLVVLIVERAWWEKVVILASSLPIALLCNTVRLTATALAFTVVSSSASRAIFHDYGGYTMMPLALGVVVAELWVLMKLTTLPEKAEAIIITSRSSN